MEKTVFNKAALDDLFAFAQDRGASDLVISSGKKPIMKLNGEIITIEGMQTLKIDECRKCFYELMNDELEKNFKKNFEVDFSYQTRDKIRVRCNIYEQLGGIGAVFRIIQQETQELDDLGLPPHLKSITNMRNGLVLITGAMGQGKSTTLSAIVNEINKNQRRHIITIEDPIEVIHENKKSIIHQREVGVHTKSFNSALMSALRENADVIMLGELRTHSDIRLALTAAETGSLVLTTLHTNSTVGAISRITDVFSPGAKHEVRCMLSGSLRFVLWQQLLPRADQEGRVLASEIMINNTAIAHSIRAGTDHLLYNAIELGTEDGMITMQQSLNLLYRNGFIDQETYNLRQIK